MTFATETAFKEAKLWMHFGTSKGERTTFVRGSGTKLTDDKGHTVIDALSGLMCVQTGYGRKEIVEAMSKASMELSFCSLFGNENPVVKELTSKMLQLAPPGFSAVFFTTGGSTAVETAIKISRQYHILRGNPQKKMFASRLYSYHGSSYGASAVSGMNLIREAYGSRIPMAKLFPPSNAYRCSKCRVEGVCNTKCLNLLQSRLQGTGENQVAAVLVEPVQNGGGAIPSTAVYMQRVRELCDEYDALMISDETICSFGRLGTWYGCQYYDYIPDMIIVGKGLSSGYAPIGAVLVSDKVLKVFETHNKTLVHGFTFGGHINACAAAIKSICILEEETLLDHVREVIEPELCNGLQELCQHPWVGNVRGAGAFWAIELSSDKQNRVAFRGEEYNEILNVLSNRLYKNGVYCRTDDREEPTLTLAPQLISTREEIRELIDIIRKTLDEVWKEYQVGLV